MRTRVQLWSQKLHGDKGYWFDNYTCRIARQTDRGFEDFQTAIRNVYGSKVVDTVGPTGFLFCVLKSPKYLTNSVYEGKSEALIEYMRTKPDVCTELLLKVVGDPSSLTYKGLTKHDQQFTMEPGAVNLIYRAPNVLVRNKTRDQFNLDSWFDDS